MVVEAEDAAGVEPDTLEDAIAVKQAVVEDRDGRFFFGDEFAVEVNFHEKGVPWLRAGQVPQIEWREGGRQEGPEAGVFETVAGVRRGGGRWPQVPEPARLIGALSGRWIAMSPSRFPL